MIRRIVNRGFKDQDRTTELTGLDLFTSDNVNGAGKSAVLEAFKLGLLGEIPGKARTLEDLLQFTSFPEMAVEVVAAGRPPGGHAAPDAVTVERRFLREAAGRKERRPIRINRAVKKYEEGDRWVRETLGAVSLGFDPFEFLDLSDGKKRQWIVAHSPESAGLDRTLLETMLFGRMVEALFGSGLAREQALYLGFDLLAPGLRRDGGEAEKFKRRLAEVSRQLDRPLAERMEAAMERAFSLWDGGLSAEENIAALLGYLKSETLRLKNALRAPGTAPGPKPPPADAEAGHAPSCKIPPSPLCQRGAMGDSLSGDRVSVIAPPLPKGGNGGFVFRRSRQRHRRVAPGRLPGRRRRAGGEIGGSQKQNPVPGRGNRGTGGAGGKVASARGAERPAGGPEEAPPGNDGRVDAEVGGRRRR